MRLSNDYLITVSGGAITTTWINALVKLVTKTIDLGKMVGTAIRKLVNKNYC